MEVVRVITKKFFEESGQTQPECVDFLDTSTREFLTQNRFSLEEHIDPHVMRFIGTYLTPEAKQLIDTKFGNNYTPLVFVNCAENSDFGAKNTFRVEIGVEEDRQKNKLRTFGVFGKSSVFCASIEAAMVEAAMAFVYKYVEEKGPAIVCWRRRMN